MILLLIIAFLVVVGLAFDGIVMGWQFRHVRWVVEGAAKVVALESGGARSPMRIASTFASLTDAAVHVTGVTFRDDVAYVTAWAQIDTYFLRILGVSGPKISIRGKWTADIGGKTK